MLAEALRLIRVYHDLKQYELAEKLSISKSYLSEIENGKKIPAIELIMKYSKEFAIPASSILFFSESIDNPSRISCVRNAIAEKIINFLQLVEARAKKGEKS